MGGSFDEPRGHGAKLGPRRAVCMDGRQCLACIGFVYSTYPTVLTMNEPPPSYNNSINPPPQYVFVENNPPSLSLSDLKVEAFGM